MLTNLANFFGGTRLLPVVEIDAAEDAPALAAALARAGIRVIEITLRTDAALVAVERILEREDVIVGLGSLLEADQFRYARQVGARFVASPGLNLDLLSVAEVEKMPYLPGVYSASEIMQARDLECRFIKFFPAYTSGRLSHFSQLTPIFKDLRFCLTGGIDASNLAEALALPHVEAVGGSWLAPRKLIKEKNWEAIEATAKEAMKIAGAERAEAAA
ncbi:MAG: bifunctional 4-hydroxy-2-oxoglutarate aldolase/2-dehydro-3-deoxy-phosphogluconate aldolase [Betaproteobacteria bacterium AqS2]|uniref:2-dehydro-3-deoxy-phosphogluconate aldolase n=1 Tax=Candidatus Amphirhobacter heronislandensis TaxID=1732024 RepID=A0A930XXR1_9GAMM|nr:bifunctional 4-hydroxy-2-oxoglutarate aldolase/2-dehydro-3-deoxy-phosphogluconate aldolase [Betaproteobacteria bacterium AqS2]